MSVRVAINGFGRIGRSVFRAGLKKEGVEFVAVNDLGDARTLAHLLKYDSVQGIMKEEIKTHNNAIVIEGKEIKTYTIGDPERLPWKELGVDVALESTGRFTNREDAERHLQAGAKKVVISAPAKGSDATFILGINHEMYNSEKHHIISMASCTTNCLAQIVKILFDEFGIEYGFMNTVHGYTNDQTLRDEPHKDTRRARAAVHSMIPTTTTAIKAIGEVIPQVKGRIDGMAVRVPTPNVALIDFVATLTKQATREEVNDTLRAYAKGPMKGMLSCSDEPLVSSDLNGNPHSSIVDLSHTYIIGGNMVRVLAWYDNEWGFSNRMSELFPFIMGEGDRHQGR